MDAASLHVSPLLPWPVLAALAVLMVLLSLAMWRARARGRWWRLGAFVLLLATLANPEIRSETREPLPSVALLVVDESASQSLAERAIQTEKAKAALEARLKDIKGIEVRTISAGREAGGDGTHLFAAVQAALADVPPERIAGVMLVTDGRVHDIPTSAALGFQAPVHALLTGVPGEIDRRLALIAAPRFGIVGQQQSVTLTIEDEGFVGGAASLSIRRDGEALEQRTVAPGRRLELKLPIAHAGPNIFEFEVAPVDGELTPINNRAVVQIEGVRDKLRVLLVSGEPHAGERTWRNLLKSDPSVDLVHFTILRPPEKQDGTPINELSLIAFPTRELFQQKIRDFDLIIFDRYARQGILPMLYFDNIANYVRNGGALLVASGADYASAHSLWRTPLEAVLPAEPLGDVEEKPFRVELTDVGRRHPVTRGLDGGKTGTPPWSRWFRLVDARPTPAGNPVLAGPDNKPALVLAREGEGRVALFLTDHIWLWARGFEGGGPHLDLLRRLSHWLMKQPDLEEEALRLSLAGREVIVERQTMEEAVPPITLTLPGGGTRILNLSLAGPGLWRVATPADELGLWRATDGKLTRLLHVGPPNPREFREVTSSPELLRPLAEATGGAVLRLARGADIAVPAIRLVRHADAAHGDDWIGLRQREASVVRGVSTLPILAGALGMLLLLAALATMWAREGR